MTFHGVFGFVLVVVALVWLTEVLGELADTALRFATPTVAGVLATGAMLFVGTHPVHHGKAASAERLDVIHAGICVALLCGAVLMAIGRRTPTSRVGWQTAMPFCLLLISALLALHEADGTEELILHSMIAASFGLAGTAQLAVVLAREQSKALQIFSVLLLALGGLTLSLYDLHVH